MAEIEEKVKFLTSADQVKLTTTTNGDMLTIKGFHFNQEQAATMAWLINTDDGGQLEFRVKVKEV